MSKDLLKKCDEDFFTLLEAGFIAVNMQDEDSAIKLFKAAEALRPNNTFPQVGFGYIHFCKLEVKQAIEIFSKVLHKEPSNEMAKSLLALCQSFTPDQGAKGERDLTELKHSDNPDVRQLADTALQFVDDFIKKAPSPVHPQKPHR